tara:strand:- start:59 stop:322 length:264 start_codon:yes stop_codon:yes gene_type:complete
MKDEILKRLDWIFSDEEITSYIDEKEKAHEEFNGEPLPWNVRSYSIKEVLDALAAIKKEWVWEYDGECMFDLCQDEIIEMIEEYLEE